MKPGPKMTLSPSPSWRTRFQSFLKPEWNLEPARGFSFNSVSPSLKPTNNNNKKKIEGRFQSFTPTSHLPWTRPTPTTIQGGEI